MCFVVFLKDTLEKIIPLVSVLLAVGYITKSVEYGTDCYLVRKINV